MHRFKSSLSILLCLCATLSSAQVTIRGKISNLPQNSKVKIFKNLENIEYTSTLLDSCRTDSEGRFALSFAVDKEGPCHITLFSSAYPSKAINPYDFRRAFNLFLFPSDNLELSVDFKDIENSLVFAGNGAERQQILNDIEQFILTQNTPNYTEYSLETADLYQHIYDSLEKELFKFVDQIDTLNQLNFTRYLHMTTRYRYTDERFMIAYNIDKITDKLYLHLLPKSYFNFLNDINFNEQYYLELRTYFTPIFRKIEVETHKDFTWDKEKTNEENNKRYVLNEYNYTKSILSKPYLDIHLAIELASLFKKPKEISPKFYDSLYADYLNICDNPEYTDFVLKSYNKMKGLAPGLPAPDFAFITYNGDSLRLSDFKEKIIIIDFWNLSCGPCIKKMPEVHEIIKHFDSNKTIEFLFLDLASHKESWLQFLTKYSYQDKGIQAHVDNNTREFISTQYNFKALPRFMIIDKKGNFLNINFEFGDNAKDVIEAILEKN